MRKNLETLLARAKRNQHAMWKVWKCLPETKRLKGAMTPDDCEAERLVEAAWSVWMENNEFALEINGCESMNG